MTSQHRTGSNDTENDEKWGLSLVLNDCKKKQLIPVKLLFFVFNSSWVIMFYLPVHMQSLGLTLTETSIIGGIVPIINIVTPYLVGLVADKIGNFKYYLTGALVLCGVNSLVFLAVPVARVEPLNVSVAIGCHHSHSSKLLLAPLNPSDCAIDEESLNDMANFENAVCGDLCFPSQLHFLFEHDKSAVNGTEALHGEHIGDALFYKKDWHLGANCSSYNEDSYNDCNFLRTSQKSNLSTVNFAIENATLMANSNQCSLEYGASFQNIKLLKDGSFCSSQCIIHVSDQKICKDRRYNPQLSVGLYFLTTTIFHIMISIANILFEGACLAVILKVNGDVGFQRLFGTIGLATVAPLVGHLITKFSNGAANFRPVFYVYAALVWVSAIVVLVINLDFRLPAENVLKNVRSVMANVELVVLFIFHCISGMFWGFIENMTYLYMVNELKGDRDDIATIFGFTLTVSNLSTIPALLVSHLIFRKLGHANLQVIGFAVYAIRLLGYSYIAKGSPELVFIFEAMESVTTALMITSAVTYSSGLGTSETVATIQGILGGQFGLGRGFGIFFGTLAAKIGYRPMYRILSGLAALASSAYLLFKIFYLNKKCQTVDKKKVAVQVNGGDSSINGVNNNLNSGTKRAVANRAFISDEFV